ncbi:Fc.00g085110.m01.CDS01 [Cosmosporella sp. VM-42]
MAGLLSLPNHLLADVLCELDNIRHLRSALLSHSAFYAAFRVNSSIPVEILRRQIPENLFSLAIAAFVSRRSVRDPRGVDAGRFLTEFYDEPCGLLGQCERLNLVQALEIGTFHDTLVKLRDGYAKTTLRKLYNLNYNIELTAARAKISPGEDYRICRALYRFQIFRNLFLDQPLSLDSDKPSKALFFDRHSPWVNEQLSCVYDYLEERYTAAYRASVVSNFEWGDNLTEWLTKKTQDLSAERWMSLGLLWIQQLLTASSRNDGQHLEPPSKIQTVCKSTLATDLIHFDTARKPPSRGYWAEEDIGLLAREADAEADDTDDSPPMLWARLYYNQHRERFRLGADAFPGRVFGYDKRALGYVIWDGSRVAEDVCMRTLDTEF